VNSSSKKAINRGRWTKDEVSTVKAEVFAAPASLPNCCPSCFN
jgi:hypothetical protein